MKPYDEAILWDALNTAQKATEKLHRDAQREVELILHEARILGEAEIEEARRKALQIRKDMVDLRSYKELFIAHLKALSRSQMEILNFDQKDEELPLIRIEEPYQESVPREIPISPSTAILEKETEGLLSMGMGEPESSSPTQEPGFPSVHRMSVTEEDHTSSSISVSREKPEVHLEILSGVQEKDSVTPVGVLSI
jgi:hypothetical protein